TRAKIDLNLSGKGLLVWSEQPKRMNTPFLSNKEISLHSLSLENWQAAGEPLQISEATQASLDAWSLELNSEGSGLLAWTQFKEKCPGDLNCRLDQTVWARPIIDFRPK